MPATQTRLPKIRRHKPSGRAVVTIGGRDHYLGAWPAEQKKPSPAVQTAYDALIAEWMAGGRSANSGSCRSEEAFTVSDFIARFWEHAEKHYRRPDGTTTNEVADYRLSLRPVRHLYGDLPAADFSPLKLKAVRQLMLDGYLHPQYGMQKPLCRGVINQRVARIVRAFRWGVSEELVGESVSSALRTVRGLQRGRTDAREPAPIAPIAKAHVEVSLPFMSPPVAAKRRGAHFYEHAVRQVNEIGRMDGGWMKTSGA